MAVLNGCEKCGVTVCNSRVCRECERKVYEQHERQLARRRARAAEKRAAAMSDDAESLECEVIETSYLDGDYEVSIRRPDGGVVKVLIPSVGCTDDGTYGLNMVTKGHYA